MAPSAKALESALLDGTYEVYSASPDETTVNKVRKLVEQKLDLADGFFSNEKWKAKSKMLIKERVEKLMDGWVPETKHDSNSNVSRPKRRSSGATSPQPKRQRRTAKPKPKPKSRAKKVESDLSDFSESSELSEPIDLDEPSEEEQPQPQKKKASAGRQSKNLESDEDDELSDPPDSESPNPEAKQGDDNVENGDAGASTPPKDSKPLNGAKLPVITLGDVVEDSDKPTVDEEEEYSDVIDEPPKPKRKQKDKEPSKKPAKSTKRATKKATTSSDPHEAEIRKLQYQLGKCGIRKFWHNELKKYQDDSRAKIRHLKQMLSDVGMDGRFSEARARHIRETRELLAEAEAAQEMNELWGMDNGGRASRSKNKSTKVVEESEDSGSNDGQEEDEGEDMTWAARRKRAQAELAFLGDDSDSE